MRSRETYGRNRLRRRAASIAVGAALGIVAAAPMAAIIDSGPVSIGIPHNIDGLYINWATGGTGNSTSMVPGWDFEPYFEVNTDGNLAFYWNIFLPNISGGVANGTGVGSTYTNLVPGATIGPATTFLALPATDATANFRAGGPAILGFRFYNEATSATNYGYAMMNTSAGTGTPLTITRYVHENTGQAITIPGGGGAPPVEQSAVSRKVQGGTPYNLLLQ